nr:MFS transporter [bacterium]
MEKKGKKSQLLMLSAYYFLIYMAGGSYNSYIALYYAELNLDSARIGLITSLAAAVTIVVQPLWGLWGDRARTKNMVLSISLISTALAVWLLPLSSPVAWLFVAAVVVFTAFQCSNNPLADAVALEAASQGGFSFTTIRTVGSVGFALVAFAAGVIFNTDIKRIFPVYSGLVGAAFLCSLFLPRVEGHQRKGEKKHFFAILKDKRLLVLYLFTLVIQGAMGFMYSFHAIHSKASGIPMPAIGTGIMIGSISQFPFMLLYSRIKRKLTVPHMLMISGFAHALRFFIYAFWLNTYTLYLAWMLHGLCYIVFYLCLADYVSTTVAPGLRASGQAMNALIIGGVSRILGSSIGGYIGQAFGLSTAFCSAAVLCLVTSVVFMFILFKTPLFRAAPAQEAAAQ